MSTSRQRHRRLRALGGGAIALLCAIALVTPAASEAAGPPEVLETFVSQVSSTSVRLNAKVNPNGISTTYHFDYITKAKYEANGNSFTGASRVPPTVDASIGAGTAPVAIQQIPFGLTPDTAYRYRVVAKNSTTTIGAEREFITQSTGGGSILADNRGWELVSPVDKNEGEVARPGEIAGGAVLQAASQGSSVTYSASASFAGGQGAPPPSQYLASRTSSGWSTQNLTQPIFSGTYALIDQGAPYRLFSADLARALLLNGDHCRGEGSECAVANPPLAGTTAPAGYQNYYLREGSSFTALLGSSNAGFLTVEPKHFDLNLAGTSADLKHPVIETCAALTSNASEVPAGEGCDPEEKNLYLWSGSALTLVNLLPGEGTGTPGAELAAQGGAISDDGSKVYFTYGGDLFLRASGQTKQADEDAGGEGEFETASADGSVAFFAKAGHLWRYLSSTDAATDITPGGGVQGVLGASSNGSILYFQDESALKRWSSGSTSTVAPGAEAALESSWPPTSGASRVSADGTKLLFASKEQLSGYDNTDLNTGEVDTELFLYDGSLICVSCNPTLGRPVGSSSISGSIPNGTAEGSTNSYKPRVLSSNGRRVFFDSQDSLVATDTNGATDAYQWQAQGEGSCNKAGGCINLISSGKNAGGSVFADASADGSDAFFLTSGSLVKADPGAVDLYDARAGGGLPEPVPPIPCNGDACQPLPSPPTDPTLTTLITGPGNAGVRFPKEGRKRCPKGKRKVKRKGKVKCVRKKKGKGKKKNKRHNKRHRRVR